MPRGVYERKPGVPDVSPLRNPEPSSPDPIPDPPAGPAIIAIRAALRMIDENFDNLPLPTKLAYIMGLVGNVPKKGFNAFHKYNYTMESDLVAAVRPYLSAAGIIIVPSVTEHHHEGDLTTIKVRFQITDGGAEPVTFNNNYGGQHLPRSIIMEVYGYGSDKGDKGVYKAMTGATKYMLMKLFLIDTGDDPEGDTKVDKAVSVQHVRDVKIEDHREEGVRRGGHPTMMTATQRKRITDTIRERNITREELIRAINYTNRGNIYLDPLPDDADRDEINLMMSNMTSEAAGLLAENLEQLSLPQDDA